MLYIGADLGTSALKLLLVDETGRVLRTVTKEYPVSFPKPGWSEQDPADWWRAMREGVSELTDGFAAADVRAIACAGQMHGLVVLDEEDAVIRPAILWNDSRTEKQVAYLNDTIGKERLSELTGNIAFAGFTAPKILWMQQNEPELYKRVRHIMLPKDYIVHRLTGKYATDYSDASGMLLLDVRDRRWSEEMCEICGVDPKVLPSLHESWEPVGTLTEEAARDLGLNPDTIVAAGAGDNAAAAIGTGTVGEGRCNISLGTSGTVFVSSDTFRVDPNNALHAFAHADGGWHLMGCMLSAASCNQWWENDILGTDDYAAEQEQISVDALGRNDVYFLPYLMGERSPINDVHARGTLTGMRLDTTRADLLQAILEGVAFAIRDSVEVARAEGVDIERSTICGGGSRSPLWRAILAGVLGIPLDIPETEQGPGYGGAILAMVADGAYPTVADAAAALAKTSGTVEPDSDVAARYDEKYDNFRTIYPALQPVFRHISG